MESLAFRLAEARKNRGLTQGQVAEKLYITTQFVSKSICRFEHPGSILQVEMPSPWDGKVYVLGYDDLTVYSVEENDEKGSEATVVRSIGLEPEDGEYCGGFVLLEGF